MLLDKLKIRQSKHCKTRTDDAFYDNDMYFRRWWVFHLPGKV